MVWIPWRDGLDGLVLLGYHLGFPRICGLWRVERHRYPWQHSTITIAIATLKVSRLCLGTMYFGSSVAAKVATRLWDSHVETGGNFIVTANKYARWLPGARGGENELLIGRWLRKHTSYLPEAPEGNLWHKAMEHIVL